MFTFTPRFPFIMNQKLLNDNILVLNMFQEMFCDDFYVESLKDIMLDLAKTINRDNIFGYISDNLIHNIYGLICLLEENDDKSAAISSNINKILTTISSIYANNAQNNFGNLQVLKFNTLSELIKDFDDYTDKQKAILVFQNILKYDPIISPAHLSKLKEKVHNSIVYYPHLKDEFCSYLEEIQKYESKILGDALGFAHT